MEEKTEQGVSMPGYANILEAVLAGEVLEAQSDWNLAVDMLAERIGGWNSNALGRIFTTNDEEVRKDLLRTALVIIEITERLDFMATDVFKFDPDGNPVWQFMRQETGQVFDQLVESMATMFGIKDIDTWVQEHFLEVGFIRMKK